MMEITREDFRWMTYDYKKVLTPQECILSLRSTFGNAVPSVKKFIIGLQNFVMVMPQ